MTDKPDVQEKLFAILEDDVKRIDRLITDISDASRLDAELTRSSAQLIDLGLMLTTLTDAYNTTAKEGRAAVIFGDDEPGVYMVAGIEARLGQVWRNLIDNALSFSPKSGSVQVSLSREEATIIVEIKDEGPGLPKGAEEKVFSRFYSERPDEEAFGSHSGLGLAISKQVIEAHKGEISARNHLDDDGEVLGACFVARLPLAQ